MAAKSGIVVIIHSERPIKSGIDRYNSDRAAWPLVAGRPDRYPHILSLSLASAVASSAFHGKLAGASSVHHEATDASSGGMRTAAGTVNFFARRGT